MTAQFHEKLIWKGEEFGMASEPLALYLKRVKERVEFVFCNTACWRGYEGTWEITDNRLFLTDLQGEVLVTDIKKLNQEKKKAEDFYNKGMLTQEEKIKLLREVKTVLTVAADASVSTLFPGQDKVFAEWFTGEIRIPQGKMLEYVHMGYQSLYEKDVYLEFKSGMLVNTYTVENFRA
jgi:hypothetical protein